MSAVVAFIGVLCICLSLATIHILTSNCLANASIVSSCNNLSISISIAFFCHLVILLSSVGLGVTSSSSLILLYNLELLFHRYRITPAIINSIIISILIC